MPMPMAKSSLRSVASLCSRAAKLGTRSFSSAARYDETYEAEKWEKISIAGIVTCAVLSIYNLSKGHHEHPEPPPYPYLRIQKKDFPWATSSAENSSSHTTADSKH
ncbi:cytochrome c oxidase subunit 6a, mitochondrial-like isoform X3 [Musa acuminata AAA Group]|uniref:cytochrome c oxidase subunit 6a, mitochondrial-like isoform X3 n=1 Tax=Musa acuminata AAA Group TaxID=214697 RepID=UPI0031E17C1E